MQDPEVSEREGVSVFHKNADGVLFHTYSTYARGIDMLNVDYQYLDLVPKGRDERRTRTILGPASRRSGRRARIGNSGTQKTSDFRIGWA